MSASRNGSHPLELTLAAVAPPADIEPNTRGPSLSHQINILSAVFTALVLVAVLIRFIVRVKVDMKWGWDDGKSEPCCDVFGLLSPETNETRY